MSTANNNVCIRCGKVRVVSRRWKEKIYGSVVINTESVCPDPVCQKAFMKDMKSQQDKRQAQQKARDEQKAIHKKNTASL